MLDDLVRAYRQEEMKEIDLGRPWGSGLQGKVGR
jgi:hypothetical protein